MPLRSVWRRLSVSVVMWCAVFAITVSAPGAATADPDVEENGTDADLKTAIKDYLDAKQTVDSTKKRQAEIKAEIGDGKKRVKRLTVEAGDFAVAAYTSGGDLGSVHVILSAGSPDTVTDTLSIISYLGEQTADKINELVAAKDDLKAEKESLADERDKAEKALDTLESARDKAARTVAAQGGNAAPGPSASDAPAAEPAPDGISSGCTEDDPTPANGCVTPRTLHALEQTQIAGFQRYASCFRSGGGGEHPRGRACDFSVESGGFGGDATGQAKAYGDSLATWLTDNADKLGVMYVIWYRQFWDPSQGWTTYTNGGGDPSSDHTNHVHLSML